MLQEKLIRSIEEQAWIDQAADPVQGALRRVLEKVPRVEAFLHGEWLGHPLHAALISLPVGSWSAALVLDVLELAGRRRFRRAADVVTTLGTVGAVAAVLPGLADWSLTKGGAKRTGFVHGSMNMVIASLYGASLVARSKGSRKAGIGLSIAGYTLAIGSAWLGGELAYRFGVGVRPQPAGRREAAPEVPVRPAAEARP